MGATPEHSERLTMALKYELESLDDIDEGIRDLYTEKDGKFVLSVDGLPEPEDNSGLKSALEKERELRKKHEKQIKQWERVGKTPDEISELIAAREESERKKAEEEGDFDKLLEQHRSKWEKEKSELIEELEATRSSERRAIIDNSLKTSLIKAGATEEGMDLLPSILGGRIKFEMDGSERVIKIMSEDGVTPLAGNAKDGTATFEDLAKWAVEKYPSLLRGAGAA
jgi:DNA-binding transcriptional MerR regulator